MAALATFVGFGANRRTSPLAGFAARVGDALHRIARVRYAEKREQIGRSGLAGMI